MSARQASGWWSQRLKIWAARRRDKIADHKRQRTRRSFLESLEPRHLMATVPVAVPDPWYSTPLNTDLVVSGGGTTLIANDFDAESLSLSASIVANPSHGTIVSSTSGGLFTYRPTTGYTGLDSFTYKVSNGTFDSNVATVSIAVGGNFGPRRNEDISPQNGMLMSGALTLTQPLTMGLNLVYRSDTALLKPIVVVETSLQSGSTVPNSIDAQLTFGGVTGSVVSYTNSGLAAGDTLRFALAADASTLTTGMHDWSMTITANFTGSSVSRTYTGQQALVDRTASEFGKGWWLEGLDRIVSSSAGALLVRGNGDTLWFPLSGGTYGSAAGDTSFATLVKNGNNTFTLTTKHGMVQNFGTTGLLTSNVDPNGNTVTFAYTDADSDSVSDELSTITDPFSRVHTLGYTSGKVTSVTDFASRAVALAYTSGKLTSVTLADPDGGGSLASPVWAYAYDATTGQLTSQTDPLSYVTTFEYDSTSKRFKKTTHPDYTTWQLVPSLTVGLKTGTGNALVETLDPKGTYTNENGNTFSFRADRFANLTELGIYSTDTTYIARDAVGLPIKITQPDAGSGNPITKMGYSASGDLLKQINPDTTTLSWTYDTTFHNVLTATDEMGRVTTNTYNSTGNILTTADPAGNTWTTSYTGSSIGLPTSITSPDPDGAGSLSAYVTGLAYDSYGRLVTLTNPDSTTQTFTYTTADQLATSTDELSHVTTIAYDSLDRVTTQTLADPDGGGSLSAPVTSFTYDALGQVTAQTDALGNTTNYAYNSRGWVTTTTYADPDGAGSLGRPESTKSYDGVGNVTASGKEDMSAGDMVYTYDAWNRLTQTTRPDMGGSVQHDYAYNVLGLLTQHTEPIGVLTYFEKWEYDLRGRVTKHYDFDPDGSGGQTGPLTQYAYNNAGQPASVTDPLGRVTAYSYTTAGWLNSVTLPDSDGSGPNFSPVITFGYDPLGRQTSSSDPLGRISTRLYDSRNRVTSETGADPDGVGSLSAPTTSYGYNNAGLVTSVTDPLSHVTSFGYDNLNRRITTTLPDPDGGGSLSAPVYTTGYNAVGSVTTQTDPLGNVTTTAYDALQRVTSVTEPDPDGGGSLTAPVTTYAYASSTLLSTITDPLSHVTTLGYDGVGRRTTVTNHEGYVTTTAYDKLDRVTSVTGADPDGAGSLTAPVTSYAYDIWNHVTSSTNPLSGITYFTFDAAGQLLTLKDPVNNITTWAYDNLGHVTMETNQLGYTRSFTHDAAGNLTRKADRNSRLTQYEFDELNRLTSEKWLTGSTPPSIALATTTEGGPVNEVQRVGYTVTMNAYAGQFTLTFSGQTTSGIAYNATAATVQSALEALSNIAVGDVVVTKLQNTGTAQEWKVTFQGALAGTDQNQITINSTSVMFMGTKTNIQATDTTGGSSTPDEVQTVTLSNATAGTFRLAFSGQTTGAIAYNASASTVETALEDLQAIDNVTVTGSAGGPWTVTFGGSQAGTNVVSLQGDAATTQSGSVSRTISTVYDVASQVTSMSDSDGSLTYGYDNMGRVTSDTQVITGLTPSVVLASVYDANSNRTSLAATIGSGADFKNDYLYDNLNRMTRVTQQSQSGGNVVATKRVDFAYNALGQFTSIDRYQNTSATNIVAQTTFVYDTLNRLTDLDHKQNSTTLNAYDYTYDRIDRITSITSTAEGASNYTYDKTNQLTGADHSSSGPTDETYGYDANGNRNTTGYTVGTNNRISTDGTYNYTYDNEGNRTRRTKISDSSYEDYAWDYRNRLSGVTFKTSGGTTTKTVEYKYDVLNRWTRRTYDSDGPGSTAAVDAFFSGYDGINPALQFDGAAASNLDHRYLWGPNVDQLMADEDVSSLTSAGNTLWAIADHLGTIRDIADQDESTHTTTIVNHRVYSAFGLLVSQTNSSYSIIFGFTAKTYDEVTKLQNNLNRWYEAGLGVWLSLDPIEFLAGDSNLGRYVGNSPTDAIDPSGLAEEEWHHKLVKAWLRKHDFIDKDGNTTNKVTGGKLNVHDKDNGIMVTPENHRLKPDGIHSKDSDGGSSGMTYDKHFEAEMQKRIKDGKISIDDLKAAGEATAAKYPKQLGDAPPATVDYKNKKPLEKSGSPSTTQKPDAKPKSSAGASKATGSARGASRRSGKADAGVTGSLATATVGVGLSIAEEKLNQAALDAYHAGDRKKSPGLYHHGECLDKNMQEEESRMKRLMGEDPELEKLPWWQRWLVKLAAAGAQSFDDGAFRPGF